MIAIIKNILRPIYKFVFRKKLRIRQLENENDTLKYQLEYMKRHFDISQMKPATGWLRDYQLKTAEYTKYFIDFFGKMDIHPFLDSGSVIGAVRHQGFIPFDDDIDCGIIRDDYTKIEKYCKENFLWLDLSDFNGNILKYTDEVLKAHPNEYISFKTPFCLHIYQGTCLADAMNIEFFPYDYVKEGVTMEQYKEFQSYMKKNVVLTKKWGEFFDFYDEELKNSKIYSMEPTDRGVPGIGNYDLINYTFYGFINTSDLFPLQNMKFEQYELPCPRNAKTIVSMQYSSLGYPSDVGISHGIENLNQYLKTIGEEINYKE